MRASSIGVFLSGLALLGAGCGFTSPLVSPQIAEPIGKAFQARPIAQLRGFGDIPKAASPQLRPGRRGSVRVTAEFPTLPADVTVLRVKNGRPTDTQIRNIANALGVPGGAVASELEGRELLLEWKDAEGLHWTERASERRLDFVNEAKPVTTLTVSSWPERRLILEAAMTFLQDHGVLTSRYGTAYVEPDWTAWWDAQSARGRCMNAQTITAIREASASSELPDAKLSPPPQGATSGCVGPEFPSRIAVRFNATQDGQAILRGDGSPQHAATIIVDAASGSVVSGWFTLPADPDRSDYPGLSLEEVRQQLARGGQGGTPNGDVTIETTTFEWYRADDGLIPRTDYLYPALVGHGTIRYPDGTTSPYRIVVPLVK